MAKVANSIARNSFNTKKDISDKIDSIIAISNNLSTKFIDDIVLYSGENYTENFESTERTKLIKCLTINDWKIRVV